LGEMELYDSTIYPTRVDTRMGSQKAETQRGHGAAIRNNEEVPTRRNPTRQAREFTAALRQRLRGLVTVGSWYDSLLEHSCLNVA
jgi:hypothetical protein